MKKLKIGNVELENRYLLGPMAGVTDLPFRLLCKEQGAGLLGMEMVSAKAILYQNKNTEKLMEIHPEEQPVSLQLFGSDPKIMSEMAKRIEERPFAILDINMGCPVPKVVKNGDGDVTTPEKAEELVQTTGCDGIMIARGAQGNPWIFSEMIGKEKNGVTPPRPDKEAIRNMILRHSKLQIQYRGEFAGMREMRKHVAWYTKGLTGAADLRRRVNETETLDELRML